MIGRLGYKQIMEVTENDNQDFRCNVCLATEKIPSTEREKEMNRILNAKHTEKTYRVIIGGGNSAMTVILCKECLTKLKNAIEEKLQ